ncbi:hypothetical protein RJ640_029627, partial [Escallonia rubra]
MGSSANGSRTATTSNGGAGRAPVDKEVDFANYFCTYAFLYHQKEMLSDRVRMDAYYDAVFRNPSHFLGKTVLDVGTGSGILAIWSAQAGARKVYAVEATKMAEHARQLVKANKLEDVVEVIEGSIEDVTLPEKDTHNYYGVDMSCLTKSFSEEQKKYYLQTSLWNNLHPNQVVGTAAIIKELDCLTATVDDILNVQASIKSSINAGDTRGRKENPAEQQIELTTAPSESNGTHWGQQ